MATSNFYQAGSHGLYVLHADEDESVGNTLANIVEELSIKGYSVVEALQNGKRVRIHDSEEDKGHILTLKKLLNGISLQTDFDFEDYDI